MTSFPWSVTFKITSWSTLTSDERKQKYWTKYFHLPKSVRCVMIEFCYFTLANWLLWLGVVWARKVFITGRFCVVWWSGDSRVIRNWICSACCSTAHYWPGSLLQECFKICQLHGNIQTDNICVRDTSLTSLWICVSRNIWKWHPVRMMQFSAWSRNLVHVSTTIYTAVHNLIFCTFQS